MANRVVIAQHTELEVAHILDLIIATCGLCLLAPLFLTVAAAIWLDDGWPIFYKATRVGRDGTLFRVYKFRTMRRDADRQGPGITTNGDPRVTRVGRWLRRTKIDELPQLLNVLRGEMALVGPRPEDPRYVAHYTPQQRRLLSVRPGITSAASLAYRHEEQLLAGPDWEARYLSEVLPDKLQIDLDYLSRRSLIGDLGLILRTVGVIAGERSP